MSVAASAWAKRQTTGNAARKCLLMVLADYAAPHDWEPEEAEGRHYAWPGQERLARETEMTDRSVRTHLDALEAAGMVLRVARGGTGEGRQSDILILPVDDDGPRPFEGNRQDLPEGATGKSEQGNRKNTTGAPYIEPPKEPPASPRAGKRKLPADFQVTDAMRAWYVENIGRTIDGAAEHAKFVDYWTGNGKLMADWPATWRNWMRRAMERTGTRPTSGAGAGAQKPRYPSAAERAQERREQEMAEIMAAEKYLEDNGGNPEDNGQLRAVLARIRSGELPLADRTAMPYIEGQIVRNDGATREVTSYATDGSTDAAR